MKFYMKTCKQTYKALYFSKYLYFGYSNIDGKKYFCFVFFSQRCSESNSVTFMKINCSLNTFIAPCVDVINMLDLPLV